MARIKAGAVTLLGISLCASAAALAANHFGESPPDPESSPPTITVAPRDEAAPKPADGDTITVRGIVLDPEGKPVLGATIMTSLDFVGRRDTKATTGADGRFAIAIPEKALTRRTAEDLATIPWLIASCPGFGAGQNDLDDRGNPRAEQTIRLIADGTPIEGRVLDLEGRPVAGALVAVRFIHSDPKSPDDLSPWIARARTGSILNLWQELRRFAIDDMEVATGDDGRFRIAGVGHDRVAELAVSGPTIATTKALALTRDEPEFQLVDRATMSQIPLIVHAPRFEVVAAPTRPIEGTIRDRDTGAPIAGAQIHGMVSDGNSRLYPEGVDAMTDADGHFRLTGLSRSPAYRLDVIPPRGSPYPQISTEATPSTATGPVVFDKALKAGVIVRGRVVEKGTGRPVNGRVEVAAFDETPHDDYPGAFTGLPHWAPLDAEGRFAIATLPGRGLLLVRSDDTLHRVARGYESIAGYDATHLIFLRARPAAIMPINFHAIVEIRPNLAADPEPITVEVDPGLVVKVRAVDPEGQPLGGTIVRGLGEMFATTQSRRVATPEFTVHGLDPSRPRRVTIAQVDRKLIGSVVLKGDEDGPVVVTLQPWGTIVGRVVDDEGNPQPLVRLHSPTGGQNTHLQDSDILPGTGSNYGLILRDDGRFRVEGLVPGLKFGASATTNQYAGGVLFRDAITKPGEITDLGDLKLTPYKEEDR